jgi:hypothetical protein
VLNSLFLVIVLFYVYPFKFLTRLILWPFAVTFNQDWLIEELSGMIKFSDMGDLMIIYGVGAFSVFMVLMLMYRYALSKTEELELNKIEIFDTKTKIKTNLLMASIPALSVLVAIIFYDNLRVGMYSGFVYFLYTPVMMMFGRNVAKRRRSVLSEIEAEEGGV